MDDQNKNLILATALSFLVILAWFWLFPPEEQAPQAEAPAAVATETGENAISGSIAPTPPGASTGTQPTPSAQASQAPRIAIETSSLNGTISLRGGRIDDLDMSNYRETIEPDSPGLSLPVLADAP
ncbi:MAG: membrane protein insertase YidC, partial [Mangrovicoccus sp.]